MTPGNPLDFEGCADLPVAFVRFSSAYELMGGPLTGITPGSAFQGYPEVYGYNKENFAVSSETRANPNRIRNEFTAKTMRNPARC